MSSLTQNDKKISLLHFWNQGIRSVPELSRLTGLPIRTTRYNVNKLKENNTLEHRCGNGRKSKVDVNAAKAIGQYIRRDSSISLRGISNKLHSQGVDISYLSVGRYLNSRGYQKSRPIKTPMLTEKHKRDRIEWAQKHLKNNWKKTVFTDETAFQLFNNTISHWHNGPRPVRRIPKDRRKIFAWGGFSIKGKTSLFCFRNIMDAPFYVSILQKHIPEISEIIGGCSKITTLNLQKKFLKTTFNKL